MPLDRQQLSVDPKTDLLVLTGDIHDDISAIDPWSRQLAARVPVVMVAGNHELYDRAFDTQRQDLAICAETVPDFHFMANEAVTIDGVRIIGAAFWFDFDGGDATLIVY